MIEPLSKALITAVGDYIGQESLLLHLSKTRKALLAIRPFPHAPIIALLVNTSGWSPFTLLRLISNLQGPRCQATLPACTDHRIVGEHVGLEALIIAASGHVGLEALLLHLFQALQGSHWPLQFHMP